MLAAVRAARPRSRSTSASGTGGADGAAADGAAADGVVAAERRGPMQAGTARPREPDPPLLPRQPRRLDPPRGLGQSRKRG